MKTHILYVGLALAVVALVASLVGAGSELAAQQKKPASPLPAEIVAAWEKAGARAGWLGPYDLDHYGGLGDGFRFGAGKQGELPAFDFENKWQLGVLKRLPQPERGFGLSLRNTKVTDAGLKELAALKFLHRLHLNNTEVTDDGLKELAGLKQLQMVSLYNTEVTGAGLKELVGLKDLHTLDLHDARLVTDAGLKDLAKLKSLRTLGIGGTQLTNAGLKELATLESLQTLKGSSGGGNGIADKLVKAALENTYTVTEKFGALIEGIDFGTARNA